MAKVGAVCNHCGASVDPSRDEPCPHCGQNAGKRIGAVQTDKLGITDDSSSWALTRRFWEVHRVWAIVLAAIVVGSPFVGLVIAEVWSIFIGLLLGLLGVVVGVFAITRVRETERGRFR